MLYSFDFAAQVTRLCMDEIRRRGKRLGKKISYAFCEYILRMNNRDARAQNTSKVRSVILFPLTVNFQ